MAEQLPDNRSEASAAKPQLRLVSGSSDAPNRRKDWSDLMARAQDGDRDAYRMLLTGIEPVIRTIAARCFSRAQDVEDAVQDTLLSIHAIRHTYDPARPFGPWLIAIANRRIIDRLRRHTRQRAREIELTAEHETFSSAPANLDMIAAEQALNAAIDTLPDEQRDAIRMLKLKEMSLKEASQATGRSIAALKTATHRAIKALRARLKDDAS